MTRPSSSQRIDSTGQRLQGEPLDRLFTEERGCGHRYGWGMFRIVTVVLVASCLGAAWTLARAVVTAPLGGLLVIAGAVPVGWLVLSLALRGRGALPAVLGPPVVTVASLALMTLEPTFLNQHDVAESAVFAAAFVILAATWAVAVPLEGAKSPAADRPR